MNEPANFDGLARAYRWLEALTFGPLLMRTRCAMLDALKNCRHALVLGDGDGRFTALLLESNPGILIDTVDASAAMLSELHRNAGTHADRVHTYVADARTWQPVRTDYDLIITHFLLDCLTSEEVRALAARLRRACAPEALWAVSEFAVPRGWFGVVFARPLVALLYRTFGVLTGLRVRQLPDHHAALEDAGFHLVCKKQRLRGLLVSELWQSQEPLK